MSGLHHFIQQLEQAGELIRIKQFVNPELEMTEIVDRVSKSSLANRAILFENTGTLFPLLINAFGSEKRICMALRVNHLDDAVRDIQHLMKDLSSSEKKSFSEKLGMLQRLAKVASYKPKVISKRGACQEIVDLNPNLDILPILKCWPHDGGKFITLPIIHTKDLHTQTRNVGMYRMQVFSQETTGLHWHLHKVSARHFHEYKKLGLKMPVAVALGGDPVYTYVATAPLPENIDEYILAGFLRKKKVQLVPCITQPEIHVPEDADIILEGYIDTTEDLVIEGPFGDHTGYYSLEDYYPKFHLTAITYQKNAVYPATIVGIPPQEDKWLGKATERIFLTPIKLTMMPEIVDMTMPDEGVFHNLVLFSIIKQFEGQAFKCMNTLWGAGQMMLNKVLVAFDEDVKMQTNHFTDILQQTFSDFNPALDTAFSKGPLDVLDHSSQKKGFGGKIGIDLTKKSLEENKERGNYYFPKPDKSIFKSKKLNPQIKNTNSELVEKYDLPIVFVSVADSKNISTISKYIQKSKKWEGIKIIFFLDENVPLKNLSLISWIILNHIDPTRDIKIVEKQSIFKKNLKTAFMFIDATSKLSKKDFLRDWPNPVCSDIKTIKRIDEIWSQLGVSDEFIPSPSLDIIPLCTKKGGAYAKKLKR